MGSRVLRWRRSVQASRIALGEVLRNRRLRWMQASWGFTVTGEWTSVVAFSVFAYQSRGPVAVGLVMVAQAVPAALLSPLTSTLGDRFRRELVILAADLVFAAAMAGSVVATLTAFWLIYPCAALAGIATSTFYPANSALAPLLAGSVRELTSLNATSSLVEGFATLLGPGLVALLLATGSITTVFAVAGAAFLIGGLAALRLGTTATVRQAPDITSGLGQLLRGFTTAARQPAPRLLLSMFAVQGLIRGAFNVLAVAVALHLVGLGPSGAGYLQAAVGVGGLIGALGATSLVGRRRLAAPLSRGLLLWGSPGLLIAAVPAAPVAVAAAGVAGIGNALVDVCAYTLMARHVRDDVLARVLGVLEFLWAISVAAGSLLIALTIDTWGVRPALLVAAIIAPTAVLAGHRALRRLDLASDVPQRELDLLQHQPLVASLPPVALERLASKLHHQALPPGTVVIQEGEPGDHMYFIAAGRVTVEQTGRTIRAQGPGDCFGEIALLRTTNRTATVRAADDVELYRLDRDEFVAAVTGNPLSAARANDLINARLRSDSGHQRPDRG